MLIEIIVALLLGIVAGTFTGLTPGIHINLIGGLLLSLSILNITPIYLAVFVVAMAVTHTFLDFIPSVFLGCPDTDTELSVLPGHELLKNKRGYEAVYLSNIGSLIALALLLIVLVPSIFFLKNFYSLISSAIPYILIVLSILIILTDKNKKSALLVFLLTGFLGYSILNFELNEPLLPLLTGLFGASNILLSIKNKIQIPEQEITKPKLSLKNPVLGSVISAPLCSFLPGIGSGQAAVIGNTVVKQNSSQFLILIGITNTLVMGFSFVSLYLIEKTRTGTAATLSELIGKINSMEIILILLVFLVAGTVAFFLTDFLAKIFSQKIKKINYTKISITTLIFLALVTILVSGFLGFLILIVSTLTGIYAINSKTKRTNMMGCLIIPTILFYFGLA